MPSERPPRALTLAFRREAHPTSLIHGATEFSAPTGCALRMRPLDRLRRLQPAQHLAVQARCHRCSRALGARRLLGERPLVGADVRLGDDSDEPVTLLCHEHPIELVLGHQLACIVDVLVRPRRDKLSRCDVIDAA